MKSPVEKITISLGNLEDNVAGLRQAGDALTTAKVEGDLVFNYDLIFQKLSEFTSDSEGLVHAARKIETLFRSLEQMGKEQSAARHRVNSALDNGDRGGLDSAMDAIALKKREIATQEKQLLKTSKEVVNLDNGDQILHSFIGALNQELESVRKRAKAAEKQLSTFRILAQTVSTYRKELKSLVRPPADTVS